MTLCGPFPSAAVMLAAVQNPIPTPLGSRNSLKSKSIRHSARAATANGVGQIPIDSHLGRPSDSRFRPLEVFKRRPPSTTGNPSPVRSRRPKTFT